MPSYQTDLFCRQCHAHMQYLNRLNRAGLDAENLLKVGFEFANLQLLAQSERRLILDRYARVMKQACRNINKSSPLDDTLALLGEGINFGLKCAGVNREHCVEMRFDDLLVLETQFNNQ